MNKKDSVKRRDFLKMTAGAAGLAMTSVDKAFPATTAGWTDGMAINPNISNMKVVAFNDPKMVKSNPTTRDFTAVTAAVDAEVVERNMDYMAMTLANKTTPNEAWKTIFQLPAGKQWSAVKAAIKINTIATTILANVATIGKVCKELAKLGVQPANIIIYDAVGGYTQGNDNFGKDRTKQYPQFFSLTDPAKYAAVVATGPNKAEMGGGTAKVTIKGLGPTKETYNVNCVKAIADGTIDLLVNISVNKGHGTGGNGNFTLSMKNHYGTFDPLRHDDGTRDYIFGINASEQILGGTPPRQQLCIVDSLWAEKVGNDGPADKNPYYWLVMGTFGPAVDYLTVKKIREPVVGASHNQTVVNAIMPAFGYTNTDPNWVIATPVAGTAVQHESTPSLQVTLSNGIFKQSSAHFSLPHDIGALRVGIFDLRGRMVRELEAPSFALKAEAIAWDGRATNGSLVSAGEYIVKATSKNFTGAGRIFVGKL